MKFNKHILIVQAHPDDTEAWTAGTLFLLKKAGFEFTIATMTAGDLGGINLTRKETVAIRKQEAQKAADVLGAKYVCLDQPDGYVFDNMDIRIRVTELIRETKAGLIFTHLPTDYHSDHRTTAEIVEAAAMVSSLPNVPCALPPVEVTPLLYHTLPMTLTDPIGNAVAQPHFYIDISSTIDKKKEMLSHHHSQIELMRIMHKMDNFFDVVTQYTMDIGKSVGCHHAEAFWQHLGGGFQQDPVVQEALKQYLVTPL